MRVAYFLLGAGLLATTPAQAQDVVLRCTGTSTMTIYNPHGKGGTIGGPKPRTWTIRTDGNSVSVTSQGEETDRYEGRDVQITASGLSYCGTADGSACDEVQKKFDKKGFSHSIRASRAEITSSGEYRYDFSWISDQAPMKTGMSMRDRADCDEDGIADLRRLASGEAPSSDSRDDEGDDARDDAPAEREEGSETRDSDSSQADDSARLESEAREQQAREDEERERMAREEADEERARAEEKRQAERDRREREEAEARAEKEQAAKDKADAEKREREEEKRRKEEEANRLIEFKEGVVLCEKGSGKQSRCFGPLQMTIVEVKTLDDPPTRGNVGMACGSDRALRDLGVVNGMRAFGCGFGIHPDPRMATYPGNNDVPARYAVYISDRRTFRCKKSVSAYCKGQ